MEAAKAPDAGQEQYNRMTGVPVPKLGLASVSTIALNNAASLSGDAAVAAMSIVGRIFMFILSAMIGFGQGHQPVVGYNYGAKRYDRVKQAFWFTFKTGMALLCLLALAGFLSAPRAMALFRADDVAVISIGAFAFRAQCLALPLQPLIVVTNMTLQSAGKSWQATFTAASRQGIFFLPLIAVLPAAAGLAGVQLTQPLADVCTFFACIPFLVKFFRELRA